MAERVLCWCRKVYVDPAIVTTSVAGEMTCSPECHHHALEVMGSDQIQPDCDFLPQQEWEDVPHH